MIYAVDFGTSNSLLGAYVDGVIHPPIALDPHAADPTILRSVMFFPDRHRCYFGAEAVREYVRHDQEGRFLRSVKKFLPSRSFAGTQVGGRNVSLEEIIATFLSEVRRRADAHFGRPGEAVLLGRPARFSVNDEEDRLAQDRLEAAARLAGFKQVAFCPEPVAAAWDFKGTLPDEKILLVADFGGGTSDFTVVKISAAAYQPSDVLSIGGVPVAGDAFDGSMMRRRLARHFGAEVRYRAPFGDNVLTMPRHLMEKICSPADISLLRQRDTMEFFRQVQGWSLGDQDREAVDHLFYLIEEQVGFELFEEIERVKRSLSGQEKELFSFRRPGLTVEEEITRPDFEAYSAEVVSRILNALDKTLADAGLQAADVDLVRATGGTARVPALRRGLEARFGKAKIEEGRHFHSIVSGLTRMASETF